MDDSVDISQPRLYEPGVADTGNWTEREAARTPVRFRERVIAQFRSPQNIAYLRGIFEERVPRGPLRQHVLATLDDAIYSYSEGEGPAYDVLLSDPVAQRGASRPAVSLWSEIRRLNRAFYENRLAFLRDQAYIIERRAPRDGVSEDEEPYHMRMFISDSLRPPGLEHLNTPGPLYALREDQSTWIPQNGPPSRQAGRPPGRQAGRPPSQAGRPPSRPPSQAGRPQSRQAGRPQSRQPGRPPSRAGPPQDSVPLDSVPLEGAAQGVPRGKESFAGRPDDGESDVYLYGDDDAPWGRGDPNRTPEQAVAEYWGDNHTVSDTMTGAPETMGQAYGDRYAWGDTWRENDGTRFMRRETIPFWQKGGREGIDGDIEETLGTAGRELDNHVRRWDMDAVRDPRGQETRRYGARTGHIV